MGRLSRRPVPTSTRRARYLGGESRVPERGLYLGQFDQFLGVGYQGRSDRFIDDVLAAPMHAWQMNLGFLVGGAFRALIIGGALAALAIPITGAPINEPFALLAAVLLLAAVVSRGLVG